MRNIKKRILGTFLSAMMGCMALSTTAFAAEPQADVNSTCYSVELTSEGITSITDENGNAVSPRSSISGYASSTLTSNPAGVFVLVDSQGWGGMGITVKASSSWNGYMSLDVVGHDGSTPISGKAVYSNSETVFNNLWHNTPESYIFSFRGIPSGQSVTVYIWVYG